MKKNKGLIWVSLAILLLILPPGRKTPSAPAASAAPTAVPKIITPAPTPLLPTPTLVLPAPAASDPYAYSARDWQQLMPSPSPEQIEQAKGSARSPYISIYPQFKGVTRALEYSVDLHADHQPNGTYLCPMNWSMDVSALKARYVSVYNDFTGVPGGYCGFQTLGDGSRVFIMTVWSTFCQDAYGNVTVFTPEVIYPEGQGRQNVGDSEGSFTQCILPYDWKAGRDYRVLLQESLSDLTGNVVLTTYVCDLLQNEWNLMVSFDTGVADVYLTSLGCFLEDFLTEYAGEVRSMELSNLRARSADSFQWVSADSVHFLFNGSLSQMYYSGSAAFGTEGCSIWAITSGVSGLCPTSSDAHSYPLSPGDRSDPY